MNGPAELLELAKRTVLDAAKQCLSRDRGHLSRVARTELGGREIKFVADAELESFILDRLLPTGLAVLSEETGLIDRGADSALRWILDPLDGSVNFSRGIGPSAISLGLWQADRPQFGVVLRLDDGSLAWGGREIGAWIDSRPIRVSSQSRKDQAIVCTGVPARFRTEDREAAQDYFGSMAQFAKVRMLGSAACSLVLVASGAADAYYEDQIMLWDVAAGLAIVEGAGGAWSVQAGETDFSCKVLAATPSLNLVPQQAQPT